MSSMLVVMGNKVRHEKSRLGPSATSGMRLRTIREPTKMLETRVERRKQQLSRKILIASKRERGRKHGNLTQVKAQ